MWPQIAMALSALAVAVLGQALFLSPESRRVRRIKAYLEVRGALSDAALHEALDGLITAEISDEARARQRSRRFWVLAVRSLAWFIAAAAFVLGTAAAWKWLDEGMLSLIVAALSAGAALTAFARAGDVATEATQTRTHTEEQSLIESYVEWAISRDLADTAVIESDSFDLRLIKDGSAVEVVEVVRRLDARMLGRIFTQRIKAVSRFGEVRFVLLTPEAPRGKLREDLLRHGIHLAHPAQDGFHVTAA